MLGYIRQNSFLHLLDARAKLALLLSFMLAQIFAPLSYAPLFFACTIAFYFLAKISFIGVVKSRLALLAIPIVPSLLRVLFEQGFLVFAGITLPLGVFNGAQNFLFLCSLVYTPLLFALTTTPSEVRSALLFFRMPNRWAFIFSIAFISVSYIQKKAQSTLVAQRARGARRNALSIMLPVLHSCFRRAKTMSLSMASRGFDPDSA
jgi:energy-coupling factor transporter transmembrane protein EcfT